MKTLEFLFFLLIFPCIAYIALDAARPDWTSTSDESVSLGLQENDSQTISNFFKVVATVTSPNGGIPVILLLFYVLPHNKIRSAKLILYTIFAAYVVSTIKLLYEDPRPFQQYPGVQAKQCETDFGKPSGHAAVGLVLIASVYWIFMHQLDSKKKINIFWKVLYILIGVPLILVIGLSRLYLGVHALSEVMLGYIYGIFFMILNVFVFSKVVDFVFEKLVSKEKAGLAWMYLLTTIIFALFIAVSIIIYVTKRGNKNLTYETIMIRLKCSDKYIPDVDLFYEDNFCESASIAVAFGALYGFLILKAKNPKDLIYKSNFFKFVMIIILSFFFAAVILVPVDIATNPDNVWIKYFFIKLIPFFFVSFIQVGGLPFIFSALKVARRNNYLEEEAALKSAI